MTRNNNYYSFEKKYRLLGYHNIAGLDEVGRGCWAGPLVTAVVILPSKYINDEIKDSKQLSGKKREILFDVIIKNAIDYQITFIDPSEVDRLNPKQATIQGMQKGVAELKIKPDILLVDSEKLNTGIESRSIVKGDQKSISIAAASILAKVSRDRYMIKLSEQYPQYHFEKHKGYGTIDHLKALKKYGPIKNFHRYSYRPVKVMLANTNKIELQ